jgi:hypothetical protein
MRENAPECQRCCAPDVGQRGRSCLRGQFCLQQDRVEESQYYQVA